MIDYAKLYRLMDGLGFREATCGTAMIRVAVDIAEADPGAMMCKDIYPEVAKLMGSTVARVERAIRAAVDVAQRSPNWAEAWREMGGWGEPTNGEVIRRLAREVQLEPEARRSIRGRIAERFPEMAR